MENHSLQELAFQSGGPASQLAVVVVDIISLNISLSDLQDAVTGAGARGWHLDYDPVLSKLTLKVRFEDKDRAESYITMFNHLVRSKMSFITPRTAQRKHNCYATLIETDFIQLKNPPYEPKALDARLRHALNDIQLSPTVASSTTGGAQTPNSTIADDLSETASTAGRSSLYDAVPWPGKMYKIKHGTSRRLITLEGGELRLQLPEAARPGIGWHWVCAEHNGWLGFRSPVSGTYMGQDKWEGMWCKVQHHKSMESFCIRRHPEGGYLILINQGNGRALHQLAVAERNGAIIQRPNGGTRTPDTRWFFEEV
jgi:hypothetical protein